MKNLVILMSALIVFTGSRASAESDYSVTASVHVLSEYLVTDGNKPHDNTVIQTDLYVTLPNNLYIDLWWSASPNGSANNDGGDEVDYTIGWNGQLNGYDVDVSLNYFDFTNIGSTKLGDIFSPSIKVGKSYIVANGLKVTPFIDVNGLILVNAPGNDAVNVVTGITTTLTSHPRWTLFQTASLVSDTGVFANDSGLLFAYQAGGTIRITNTFFLDVVKVKLAVPITDFSDGRDNNAVVGTGVVMKF